MFLIKKRDKTEGFTLIELMIVIVIIGILVSIALPNFVAAQERAKMASLKSNIRTLRVVSETYSVDWGGVPAENVTVLHNEATAKSYWKDLKNPFTGQSGFGFAVSVYNTPIMGVINPFLPLMFASVAVSDSQQQDSAPPLPNVVFVNSNGENVAGLVAYVTEQSVSQNLITKYYIVGSIKKKDGSIDYLTNKGSVYFESNGGAGGGSNGGNNTPNPNPSGSIGPNPYPSSPSGYVSPNPYPSGSTVPGPYPTSPSGGTYSGGTVNTGNGTTGTYSGGTYSGGSTGTFTGGTFNTSDGTTGTYSGGTYDANTGTYSGGTVNTSDGTTGTYSGGTVNTSTGTYSGGTVNTSNGTTGTYSGGTYSGGTTSGTTSGTNGWSTNSYTSVNSSSF